MKFVRITAAGPRLEGVFGPLSGDEEQQLRRLVLEAGDRLGRIEQDVRGSEGSSHVGLYLTWAESGQTSIDGTVSALDRDKNSVVFTVGLRPGWFYGKASDPPTWLVELSVEADCLHSIDHEAMETVYTSEVATYSPGEAVASLVQQVDRLADLAASEPMEHWTNMTRD